MARARRPAADEILVADFFEITYLRLKLRNRSAAYADVFRGAIHWLRKAVRREPLVADLTRDQLALTFKTMAAAGIAQGRLRDVRKRLVQLWQFASVIGLAGPPNPPPICRPGKQPARPWDEMSPAPGTLLWHYRQEFRPQLVLEAGPKVVSYFDCAVNHFHDLAQAHVVLDTIDQATLDDFAAALMRLGKSEPYVNTQAGAIRRIVRTMHPERFPVLPGPAPKLLASERAARAAKPPAEPGTLRHFYETVYLPERLIGASRHTLLAYPRLFSRLKLFLAREALLSDLNNATVAAFMNWSTDTDSPGTINNRRALLLTLWRMARDEDLVQTRPRLKKLKTEREDPDAWTPEEIARIIHGTPRLDQTRKPIHGIPAGAYWKALLLVTWYTAMRRRSLFSLRWADVDFAHGTIYARPAGVKTKKGKRYKLGPDALTALRAIMQPERELLFPPASHPHVIFGELLALAGLADSAHRLNQFHKLRRSAATAAAGNGGMQAAMRLLDHSSAQLTARYIASEMLPANDATRILPPLCSTISPETLAENSP